MFIGGTVRPLFEWNATTGVLQINTYLMTLRFQNGAVVGIYDNARQLHLIDSDQTTNMESENFIGFSSTDSLDHWKYRLGDPAVAIFSQSGNTATITYSPVYRYTTPNPVEGPEGSYLIYTFVIDSTGEITISFTGKETDAGFIPAQTFLPIMNFPQTTGHSVIAASREFKAADTTFAYPYNFFGQVEDGYMGAAVMRTPDAAIGIWNERTDLTKETTYIYHYQNSHAHISFASDPEPVSQAADNSIIHSGPWRFTIKENWLEVARRWRVRFEALYPDTKPLWSNATPWVRDIHALYSRFQTDMSRWDTVAGVVDDTAKVLYFPADNYGGEQVVYGDNNYVLKGLRPTANDTNKWYTAGYNFKVLGYYGCFCLLFINPDYWKDSNPSLLPDGYVRNDSTGPPNYEIASGTSIVQNDLAAWLSGISLTGVEFYSIHLGSDKGRAYINFNYPEFCSRYGKLGCYWDTLCTDHDSGFVAGGIGVFNGKSSQMGSRDAAKAQYATYPIMSEDFHRGFIAYCFYTWNGGWSIYNLRSLTANHPFRTACLGSYMWTYQGVPSVSLDPAYVALLGCLPEFMLDDDYQHDAMAPWSQAVATLYCQYELFNDLPTTWINSGSYTTLAYYRSNTGNMFRFEDRGSGTYAYVEEDPGGDIDRLVYPLP